MVFFKNTVNGYEFDNTLYLAEQPDGIIIDWQFLGDQAPHDCNMLKESHGRIEERLGVAVKLMAGDRGFDSDDNRKYLQSNDRRIQLPSVTRGCVTLRD